MPVIRVASVPHDQVYIRHCGPVPGDPVGFERLPDPRPSRGDGTEQSGWWPPAMLEQGWITEHRDDFDIMHVHFGFDALAPEDLERVVDDLRRERKPLVYTVHDLGNPHHTDPAAHRAALDVLIPGAEALVTLTEGAAREVRELWGREALVLPHPHVVDLDKLEVRQQQPRVPNEPLRVGVHLKSLRPNMASTELVEALVESARVVNGHGGRQVAVQVNAHPDVMDGTAHQQPEGLSERLRSLADDGSISLEVRPYFDEDELFDYLQLLDASVLPYRWGTHSGWLEACVDLGTWVIAPDCGYYADQRRVLGYHQDRDGLDRGSLTRALERLAQEPVGPRLSVAERTEERRVVAKAHEELYRGLLH